MKRLYNFYFYCKINDIEECKANGQVCIFDNKCNPKEKPFTYRIKKNNKTFGFYSQHLNDGKLKQGNNKTITFDKSTSYIDVVEGTINENKFNRGEMEGLKYVGVYQKCVSDGKEKCNSIIFFHLFNEIKGE